MIVVTSVLLTGLAVCLLGAQTADPELQQRIFQEGEKALSEKRYEDAAKAYEELRKLDPRSAELQARLGMIYFQAGRFAQAAPVLKQALKLKPGLPNADILLAMALSELGQYREALPGLEKGFALPAENPLKRMAGLQLQRAHTGLHEDASAVKIALEMTRLYPKDPEVLYHAGQLFGNFAYLTMRQLSSVAPDSVWTIQAIGEAQESQGAYELAIVRYRQVIERDPRRPGIHFKLGRVLLLQSQQKDGRAAPPVEAMRAFERELEIDPTNANAAYELGAIHQKLGAQEKAQAAFERALQHYPDFQEAAVGLGRTLIAQKKPAEAAKHLQKAVLLNPSDDVAYFHLARANADAGNPAEQQKALAEFRRLRNQKAQREQALIQRTVTPQETGPE